MYMIKKIVCGFAVLGVLATSGILSTTQDVKAVQDVCEVKMRENGSYRYFYTYTECYRNYKYRLNAYLNQSSNSQIRSWGEKSGVGLIKFKTFDHPTSKSSGLQIADFYAHRTTTRLSTK